jgi:hypothetical protein
MTKVWRVALGLSIIIPTLLALAVFFTAWAATGSLTLPESASPYGLTVQKPAQSAPTGELKGLQRFAVGVCPLH